MENLNEELKVCLREQNLQKALEIIKKGADPNTVYYSFDPVCYLNALHLAALKQDLVAWEELKKKGAKCDQIGVSDFTEIIRADRCEVVKDLVENYGIKVDNHAFKVAVCGSAFNTLKYLASKRSDFDKLKSKLHLVHYAASGSENVELIEYLLNGENINSFKDEDDLTPIFYCKKAKTLKYLVEAKGARIDMPYKYGPTLLHHFLRRGAYDIDKDGIEDDIYECVKWLVEEAEADVNISDNKGWTPLKLSLLCRKGLDTAKVLIGHGAEIEGKGKVEKDCGDYAYGFGEPRIETIGAESPLWTVATYRSRDSMDCVECMEYLISEGADINCTNEEGQNLISYLLCYGRFNLSYWNFDSKMPEAAVLLSHGVKLCEDSLAAAVYCFYRIPNILDRKAEYDSVSNAEYKALNHVFNQLVSKIGTLDKDDLDYLKHSEAFICYVDNLYDRLLKFILEEQNQSKYFYLLSDRFLNKIKLIQDMLQEIDFSKYSLSSEELEERRELVKELSNNYSLKIKELISKLIGDGVAEVLPKLDGKSDLGAQILDFLAFEDQEALLCTKKINLSHLENQCHKKQRIDYRIDDMVTTDQYTGPIGVAFEYMDIS